MEYYLNVLFYFFFLREKWSFTTSQKYMDEIMDFLSGLLFLKRRYQALRRCNESKGVYKFLYGKVNSPSIVLAEKVFTGFCWCYAYFFSFVLFAITLKADLPYLSFFALVDVALPGLVLNHIVNKKVFKKNRYLDYFKRFERKDEQWHRKWKLITLVFSVCALLSVALGFATFFAIMIYL